MHVAARGGHTEIVALLISEEAIVNAEDNGFRTPLGFAEEEKHDETAILLRKYGANMGTQPLVQAVITQNTEQIKLLLSAGADVNIKLKYGPGNVTPLHIAAFRGYENVTEILLANGADINVSDKRGITSLTVAKRQKHTEVANILLQHGARETLHGVIFSGDVDEVERLLSQGADINAKNEIGQTPLIWALKNDQIEVAELLLAKGVDVNLKNRQGRTAIDVAKERNHTDTVVLLRKNGARE
jgi:ankyrin repeat protein